MIFATYAYVLENKADYRIISYKDCNMNGYDTYWNSIFYKCSSKLNGVIRDKFEYYTKNNNVYLEEKHEYEPIKINKITTTYNSLIIKGYFQSYKYFDKYYDTIYKHFEIESKKMEMKVKYSDLFKKRFIAMHFVIGDYINIQDVYCIKKPIYYIQALNSLIQSIKKSGHNIDDYNVLCFFNTNDAEYIGEYILTIKTIVKYQIDFIEAPIDIKDYEKLMLMSCCDHFIISNCSFAWFGAYFSDFISKEVYYPKKWFNVNRNINTIDMFPSNWKGIDS